MGQEKIKNSLNRRMWREDGVYYFCRICGDYQLEENFYKSKRGPFKIDTKCKIHYTKREQGDEGEMDYLKLSPLTDDDFTGAQALLEKMGYSFTSGSPSVYQQFIKKHNL